MVAMDTAWLSSGRLVWSAIGALALLATGPASAHEQPSGKNRKFEMCRTSAFLGDRNFRSLSAPFNQRSSYDELKSTPLWKNVISELLVNVDKTKPCFAMSDTPIWGKVVSKIPADVVGIRVSNDLKTALIYVTGIPDYTMETPKLFASFKPGNIYGVYKISSEPKADSRPLHELVDKGAIGLFVNGVSIFNYTDSFSYNDKGVFAYDANVAEASIVNSDISHATPSDAPNFPKSRGIFHNHQMSIELLTQLKDPYVAGARAHSKLVGFAIDSYPIYGPLGYTSRDKSSGIKVLKPSYVKRSWLSSAGTGNRSSIPDWVVRNWDGSNATGANLVNLFGKPKADMLLSDAGGEGPVKYNGDDAKLAAEIAALDKKHGLKRDSQGHVYWETNVRTPRGKTVAVRNYLLKSSDLWGAKVGAEILPVSFQVADKDKFLFKAVIGAFAEDYEFISGYGDLDFYNGIDSYVPEQNRSVYHYVASFRGDVSDKKRLKTASFPYFIGIRYKGVVDPFNASLADKARAKYLTENEDKYRTVFDLGIIGRGDNNKPQRASVIEVWKTTLGEDL
jgi:hypothetical protein